MGFMGAGKSTVGALLARRLGWRFVDADDCLAAEAGKTIADIFTSEGEAAFRSLESAVVREQLAANNVVLALGGGAVETDDAFSALQTAPNTLLVFLDAPLSTLIRRCDEQSEGAVRPVLNDRTALEARWQRRLPLYRQAHLTIPTEGLKAEAVSEQILRSATDLDIQRPGEPKGVVQ